MDTNTVNTRIKNKVDNYSVWKNSKTPLLNGEIAIVRVQTGQTYENPVTGKTEPVVELLMKVGDGTSAFDSLPWLSAKASDVYNWAKNEHIENVNVKAALATNATEGTEPISKKLSEWFKIVSENTETIAAHDALLSGDDNAIATLIKAAIEELDANAEQGSGNFVRAVTQTDGKITVTKCNISEEDLPKIAAAKIIVRAAEGDTPEINLHEKLASIDVDISELSGKKEGHTDDEINTLIDNKLDVLTVTSPTTNGTAIEFIDTISQTDGKISATKKKILIDVKDGVASFDKVSKITEDIAALQGAVTGGVHFVGEVASPELSDNLAAAEVTFTDNSVHTANPGDVVIQGSKEFIWTSTVWKELGDLSRVGTLETLTNGLISSKVANQFVTHIEKVDNKLVVQTARPTVNDIVYGESSLAEELSDITGKLDGITGTVVKHVETELGKLDSTCNTTGDFVTDVTQENGKVNVVKGNLPTATQTTAGITKLGAKGGAATYEVVDSMSADLAAVEANYVRFNSSDNKLYIGSTGTDEIIFDCGGAPA